MRGDGVIRLQQQLQPVPLPGQFLTGFEDVTVVQCVFDGDGDLFGRLPQEREVIGLERFFGQAADRQYAQRMVVRKKRETIGRLNAFRQQALGDIGPKPLEIGFGIIKRLAGAQGDPCRSAVDRSQLSFGQKPFRTVEIEGMKPELLLIRFVQEQRGPFVRHDATKRRGNRREQFLEIERRVHGMVDFQQQVQPVSFPDQCPLRHFRAGKIEHVVHGDGNLFCYLIEQGQILGAECVRLKTPESDRPQPAHRGG